jgi:hypothetical protein
MRLPTLHELVDMVWLVHPAVKYMALTALPELGMPSLRSIPCIGCDDL